MAHKTLYDRLGISRSASDSDVFAAFRRYYAEYGESMPLDLMRAYQILRDREKRVLYDWVLDQYHSGFPVEVPRDRVSAFQECCKDFGFELTKHPSRENTYELSIPARRPPGFDALPADSGFGGSGSLPTDHQSGQGAPPSHRQNTAQANETKVLDWWPPKPLVLGSRIYHWACFKYRVLHVVRTTRTAELHLEGLTDGSHLVINSASLIPFTVHEGDILDAFGLGELAVEQRWYFAPIVNTTRRVWILSDGWEKTIPWQNAATYFGIRRKRREIHDILTRYLTAACELALRDVCCTPAELAVAVPNNVQYVLKTRLKLPWFNLPT